MPVQIYNAELVELLRSRFQDKGEPGSFAYNQIIPWVDVPLQSTTDGNHFNDNDSSYPQGWAQVDAAFATDTSESYGFWLLTGNNTTTSWKYRRQGDFNVEADSTDGDFISFTWGPILWRDGNYPSDMTYYFGVYADNSGAINEDLFIRTALRWDASGGRWRARHERKDGTTQTNGSWYDISQFPLPQPVFVRNTMRYRTSGTESARSYIGTTPFARSHTALALGFMTTTWGQVWWQVQMTRPASGIEDYLLIGGVDRGGAP